MVGWSRMARASIVIVGMALAIPLFWLGRPGPAVVVGFVALAVFWLTLSAEPSEPELAELDDKCEE
jgi:fatty acid desaturase